MIPRAEISLLGSSNQPIRTLETNEAGEIVWSDLPLGDSTFQVRVPGFNSRRLTVTVRNSGEQTVETRLELGYIGERVTVEPIPILPNQALAPVPPAVSARGKAAKRKWWQIFR